MNNTPTSNYQNNYINSNKINDSLQTLNVASINVCGGNSTNFFTYLCDQGTQSGYDIIGVQETKISQHSERHLIPKDVSCQYIGIWEHTDTNFLSKGVGFLVKKEWHKFHIITTRDNNGRGISITFGFKSGFRLAIINCYLPSRSSRFYNELQQTLDWIKSQIESHRSNGARVILMGDFNGVINPSLDRALESNNSCQPELLFFDWLSGRGFIDTYRQIHPLQRSYTYKDISRIDMIWTTPDLTGLLLNTDNNPVLDPIKSDHSIISAIIDTNTLINPTPHNILSTHAQRSKKIIYDNIKEEQWEEFSQQVEDTLIQRCDFDNQHLKDYLDGTVLTIKRDELNMLDLNNIWSIFKDAVMSSALHHLPKIKTGGVPAKRQGEQQLRHKISDLGQVIFMIKTIFLQPTDIDIMKQQSAYNQIYQWFLANGTTLDLPMIPAINDIAEIWEDWMEALKSQWRISRMHHQDFCKSQRQRVINEYIEKRDKNFETNTKQTIKNILDICNGRVHLDHLVIEDDPRGLYVIDDPVTIKEKVRQYFCDTFHAERVCEQPQGRWIEAYRPRDDINENWFSHLMDPPTNEEVLAAIQHAPNIKAPGLSGLTGDLIKHLGPVALKLFITLLQASVVQETMPDQWMQGLIYCIPKGPVWSGKISEIRPIALLEHSRKILFTILVDKLSQIFLKHSILRGPNFSVLKGTMTKDPIHILNSIMEEAREFDKELWVLFQDMRRAYDSVSCGPNGMLHRSLQRLKIHPGFIRLCLNIAEKKENRIITAYGLTDPYHPQCGLDQGGVECPLFWRIVYDVLLTEVMDSGLGYQISTRSALTQHHKIRLAQPQLPDVITKVAGLAFVDDTTWIAPNNTNLQQILEIAQSFFDMNKIEINPKKSELIAINSTTEDTVIQLGNDVVSALSPNISARMLGVWFSADGKNTRTKAIVQNEVDSICSILSRKAVTDKQTIYIINNVLIPRILYRLTTNILSKNEVDKITGQYTSVVRQKVGLAKGTPSSILYHRRFYGLRHFGDVQAEEQISTALLRINDHGLVGEIMKARAMAHQMESSLSAPTFQLPTIGSLFKKHNFMGSICQLMNDRQIYFRTNNDSVDTQFLIANLIPPKEYKKIGKQLINNNINTLQDIVTEDGKTLASRMELKNRNNIRLGPGNWYNTLVKHLCEETKDLVNPIQQLDDYNVSDSEDEPLEDPRKRRREQALALEIQHQKDLALARQQKQKATDVECIEIQQYYVVENGPGEGHSNALNNIHNITEIDTHLSQDPIVIIPQQEQPLELSSNEPTPDTVRENELQRLVTECTVKNLKIEKASQQSINNILSILQQNINIEYKKKDDLDRKYNRSVHDPNALAEMLEMNKTMADDKRKRLQATAQIQLDNILAKKTKKLEDIEEEKKVQERVINAAYNRSLKSLHQQRQKDELKNKKREQRIQMEAKYSVEFNLKPEFFVPIVDNFIQNQPTGVTSIGPILVPTTAVEAITRMQDTPVDNSTPRTISTDGSMINADTNEIAMGFGVIDRSQASLIVVGGKTGGYASSTKAELMGLLAAIIATPPMQDITIELDNQAVVTNYQQLVELRDDTLPRKKLRSNYAALWAVIHDQVQQRPGKVIVKWVKGHSNNEGNIIADHAAKIAVTSNSIPWIVNIDQQTDIQHHAYLGQEFVEIDLRQLLKKQTTIRRHQAWTAQRRTKRAFLNEEDIEWRSTLAHVHNKRAVHTFFSNSKDTSQRVHHIKKLHGMLPTMNVMYARHPDLFEDKTCRVCDIQDEDNQHLWTCSNISEIHKEIWTETLSMVDIWGRMETKTYNKEVMKRYHKAKDKGDNPEPPKLARWKTHNMETHYKGLASIGGTQHLLLGEGHYDRSSELVWNISTLYRGITPKSLIREWGELLSTPMSIAKKVIHRFVGFLEKEATEKIWKPRCSTTIADEKAKGVTKRRKYSKYQGPRGAWSDGYGYIDRVGQCPCGAYVVEHVGGQCPGPNVDVYEADTKLQQSLFGTRRLQLMEGMGKIPFL